MRRFLVLFDEVLNFVNRHRKLADHFHAFIQNLTVAMTATTRGAALISLPRSQVEMTEFDLQWQEKLTKVVRRVAKDLIANDETEISEVVRRRLFDDIGPDRVRTEGCPRPTPTGASNAGQSSRRSGWWWTVHDHRGQSSGTPARAIRSLLSVPSGYAFSFSSVNGRR